MNVDPPAIPAALAPDAGLGAVPDEAVKLKPRLWEALTEIATWYRSEYYWRQVSMRALKAHGFVKETDDTKGKSIACWKITPAGRAYWESHR